MKKINGQEIIDYFEKFSPKKYAVEGDKIGLQVGRLNREVDRVIVTLDVNEAVVDEAIAEKAQLIIAHHPLIFRPLKTLLTDSAKGRVIEKLIKNDIAVYVAHTNLDVTKGGVNDLLAEALKLNETDVLVPTYEEELGKLVVYVPVNHAEAVRKALGDCGAGSIGNYSHCSFTSLGEGRFLPGDEANPYSGIKGELKVAEEVKLEVIYEKSQEKALISALKKAHPYEEVAYDLYKLENSGIKYGLGRIGNLESPQSLEEFANFVKEALKVPSLRVVGDLTSKIKRVAVLGGDGNRYFTAAKFAGADVYVTGDVYYHTAQDAEDIGLNIVDPGHHIEEIMKHSVAKILTEWAENNNFAVKSTASTVKTEPFQFI